MIGEGCREILCFGARDLTPRVDPIQPGCPLRKPFLSHVSLIEVGERLTGEVEASKEVFPLPHLAQALQGRRDFGRRVVGGILCAVQAILVTSRPPLEARDAIDTKKKMMYSNHDRNYTEVQTNSYWHPS